MVTRLLPPDDWARLAGTELETVWPHLPPTARVIVVEDGAGSIIACWCLFTSVHLEGVFIAPEHRNNGAVARRLIRAMRDNVKDMGADAAWTSALTPEIAELAVRIGGKELPGRHFVVKV